MIVHCATGQAVSYDREMDDDAEMVLQKAIEGEQEITLRQLAKRLKRIGVDAKFGSLAKGHCACRPETHKASF